jgi:hypothetical protein
LKIHLIHRPLLNLRLALKENYNMYNYDKFSSIIKGSTK